MFRLIETVNNGEYWLYIGIVLLLCGSITVLVYNVVVEQIVFVISGYSFIVYHCVVIFNSFGNNCTYVVVAKRYSISAHYT